MVMDGSKQTGWFQRLVDDPQTASPDSYELYSLDGEVDEKQGNHSRRVDLCRVISGSPELEE
jgi:hypothetical protein